MNKIHISEKEDTMPQNNEIPSTEVELNQNESSNEVKKDVMFIGIGKNGSATVDAISSLGCEMLFPDNDLGNTVILKDISPISFLQRKRMTNSNTSIGRYNSIANGK